MEIIYLFVREIQFFQNLFTFQQCLHRQPTSSCQLTINIFKEQTIVYKLTKIYTTHKRLNHSFIQVRQGALDR